MPGIHVPSTDLSNNGQDQLKVPGHFYMHHRKTVHKFCFHLSASDENYSSSQHGEELTRIVKLVLRKPPKEGEQFSTRNLVATFKTGCWLRNEKIMALTKFEERPEKTAANDTVELTIKVKAQPESPAKILDDSLTEDGEILISLIDEPEKKIVEPNNSKKRCRESSPSNGSVIDLDKTSRHLKKLKTMQQQQHQQVANNILTDNRTIDNISSSNLDSPSKNSRCRSRQESKENEFDNLKSSNITDLVMKGRMIVMSQHDVVEQTTKTEVDEVLENSEEVETVEGDSRLVNSSLWNLEKMVTCIKEPVLEHHRDSRLEENLEDCDSEEDDFELKLEDDEDEDDQMENLMATTPPPNVLLPRDSPKILSNELVTNDQIHPDIVRSIQLKSLTPKLPKGLQHDGIVVDTDNNSNIEIKQISDKTQPDKTNKVRKTRSKAHETVRRSLRFSSKPPSSEKLPKKTAVNKKTRQKNVAKSEGMCLKTSKLLNDICLGARVVLERLEI